MLLLHFTSFLEKGVSVFKLKLRMNEKKYGQRYILMLFFFMFLNWEKGFKVLNFGMIERNTLFFNFYSKYWIIMI